MYKSIISISPGPTYNAHSKEYQRRYELLSKSFEGHMLTTSSKSEEIQISNFAYHSVKSKSSSISKFKFLLFCLGNAMRIMRKGGRIDLVAVYDPLLAGLIGLMISRLLRAKVCVEVNGVYTSPIVWIDENNRVSRNVKLFIYPRIMRFVLRRADGIKLLFSNQIDSFKNALDCHIVRDFPNYVSVSEFTNRGEEKEVLFVGFPFKLKGVDILIKAFKKIAPNYPDWRLKILGWFPDPTELNRAIGGHSQIYHHPPVHYNEMPEHIGSCAILVLPSRSEAMGRVLVEAMAAGKPRIGSNVDGIPTVINDGVDGFLCEPGNIEDLAKKMDLLMGNVALRRKLGKAGEIRAKKEFSEEVYINNIINFYNDVIEKS